MKLKLFIILWFSVPIIATLWVGISMSLGPAAIPDWIDILILAPAVLWAMINFMGIALSGGEEDKIND